MKKLLRVGWILAFVFAALVYPVAAVLNAQAIDAYLISAKPPEMVRRNRALLGLEDRGAPDYKWKVMQAYGSREEETTSLLFVPKERLIRPEEYPELTIALKDPAWEPFQARTLWFFAHRAAAGAAVAGLVLLVLWIVLTKRRAPAPSPPPAA